MTTCLEAALIYAARGWPVVALHHPAFTGAKPVCSCEDAHACTHVGKHPRYHSTALARGANSATTNTGAIGDWWRKWPDANVGIVVGPVSGLLVLDIDPRNGGDDTLAALEAELGPLPHTVKALTGGGGRHLLFLHPGGGVVGTLGDGVDVLGSPGQLIVAAPSLHASGKRCCWELSSVPGAVELAVLPEVWKAKILRAAAGEDMGYRDDRETGTQGPHPTGVDPAISDDPAIPAIPVTPPPDESQWNEDRVFRETLPTGRGQHDTCNMKFARGVRLNLGHTTPESARAIFDRWWELARPHCADQDPDSAWFKFQRAFDLARISLGMTDLASLAYEAASRGPLPMAAHKFRGDRVRLLVGMCCHLQRIARGPFRLSCHQIANLFDVKPAQAWDWLRGLEKAMVLRCVNRGKGGTRWGKAATFEYLGDDPTCTSGSNSVDSDNGGKN